MSGHLSAPDLTRLCGEMLRWTGMNFGESRRYYVERRVFSRMDAVGDQVFDNYFARLARDPGERENLINAFTVNETYFYREEHQFACMVNDLLPDIAATRRPGDKIRIWSAPCSTGEEAYSIALWLLDNWRMVDAYNVEIVGSDIDTDALEAARAGLYGERALARLPEPALETYFEPLRRHRRKIIDDLRESVTFTFANLIDAASLQRQGLFDIIFCRNVLIYFDEAARQKAADNLYDRLAPGGYVCLGHSEAMTRINDRFVTRRFKDATVYQRAVR
ncbi:protein-glutamate O-methyltransferase CheR [Caulobacter segnis]|uniref:CheR family methyltransferase n=1 Tax=Caulobacter segnis TaxID=88688 RepID=UPI00241040E3|nr:protein-glutamate O-methyltransferase CheR [Caulobacter segnis]MDG2522125.1 protein-glutamate O-methyltransferase CheR [Caulobacter segnis]